MTEKTPDNKCLTISEAKALLEQEFGIDVNLDTLRRWAREHKLPFFRIDPTSSRDPFLISAGDIRKTIWRRQNEANNRVVSS